MPWMWHARYDIAEILLKLALNTNKSIIQSYNIYVYGIQTTPSWYVEIVSLVCYRHQWISSSGDQLVADMFFPGVLTNFKFALSMIWSL